MSIDLHFLSDKYIKKEDIERDLYELGFEDIEGEENSYHWFSDKFLSTRGCHFSLKYDIKIENLDTNESITYPTICTTITYAGRSHDDFQMQFDVLQMLKHKYGGIITDFEDDEEIDGLDNGIPKLSSTEIACGSTYSGFINSMYIVQSLIEDCSENKTPYPFYSKPLLRNNTLIPFCVTVLENFLKTFLERYLQTNDIAKQKIFKKRKGDTLPYYEVEKLLNGEKTIIDLELERYSFQNFKSTNIAYKKFLDFDLYDVLGQKIIYQDDESISLNQVLTELIEMRHKIIHEAKLNDSLSKKVMEKYHFFLKKFGELFIEQIMKKHKLRLLIEKLL
ncbi:hypothetical protein MOF25_06595 [Bacillus atrophaeus]|uniref:hypothetical protein n=1 Tax=Bacillus atrophaeus TaxID=1452 RepID=UPI00228292CC|nr:hypothetical protein [Bacillus atrophaeus]MCY8802651.1 hypothetical protein [Bacillus spizizenii]MCY9160009.1 hypothetical protein [Bacillus atrophaeus]